MRTTAEIYTKQQNDKLKSEGLSQEIVNSDVYLGEFVVYTTALHTQCRDYGAVDGDNVRIWLNDEIIDCFLLWSLRNSYEPNVTASEIISTMVTRQVQVLVNFNFKTLSLKTPIMTHTMESEKDWDAALQFSMRQIDFYLQSHLDIL